MAAAAAAVAMVRMVRAGMGMGLNDCLLWDGSMGQAVFNDLEAELAEQLYLEKVKLDSLIKKVGPRR